MNRDWDNDEYYEYNLNNYYNSNYSNYYNSNNYYFKIIERHHNNLLWPECRNCTVELCDNCKLIRSEYPIFLYCGKYTFMISTDRFTLSELQKNVHFKITLIPLNIKYGYMDYNLINKTLINLKNNLDIDYLEEYEKNKFRVKKD